MSSALTNDALERQAEDLFKEGVALHRNGQLAQARACYRQVLTLLPRHHEALHFLGALETISKNYAQAIDFINQSIEINPRNAAAYVHLGHAFKALGQYQVAAESYDKAIALRPDAAQIHFKRGVQLSASGQFLAAIDSYDKAIAVKPDYSDAYFNRGNALNELTQRQAAIESYDKAIALKPESEIWQCVRSATMRHVCDWRGVENQPAALIQRILDKGQAFFPFQVLALTPSPRLHRHAAEIWIRNNYPANLEFGNIPKHTRKQKIRIAYFSMDFCIHPVSILTAELFELHDRARFEIYAFSYGPDTRDEMRIRLQSAFDKFIDVRAKSDREIVQTARQLQIDIAIDLAGLTGHARTGIFAMRAAPLQVNYIGYPGTMGATYIDFLIADRQLIPEESRANYAEKIVYLPSFQANDRKRRISDRVFTRDELGLPESAFVFCCFNKNYKFTPGCFAGWMRILKRVDNSVLFLYAENDQVISNLEREASERGVDSHRLVFGSLLSLPEHLARYRCVDLFLDTFPFNAGATASDALWAGVPVLTCSGETFASRMGASLLTAIDLPELITSTQQDYEAMAVQLATHPEQLQAIQQRLKQNRLTTPLFDSASFIRHLEDAYTQMVERYRSELAPDHIFTLPLSVEIN